MLYCKIVKSLTVATLLLSTVVSADGIKPNFTYSNISLNYLDWSLATENRSVQRDFSYLEFEGGAGWDWGDFYIFFDVENPTKSYSATPADNMRFAFKPVLDIKLVDNIYLHIQDYNLHSDTFYVHNLNIGLSYKINTDFGLWLQPFIGPHYQESTYYSGYNGYMAGWVFNYKFKLAEASFSIAQWHEFKFARDSDDGYDDHLGTQGALSFWWHPVDEITTGFQYRYAHYELGSLEYQDGIIYSLKYNF